MNGKGEVGGGSVDLHKNALLRFKPRTPVEVEGKAESVCNGTRFAWPQP